MKKKPIYKKKPTYLMDYIQKNYKRLWPSAKGVPRFVSNRTLKVDNMPDFLAHGRYVCSLARTCFEERKSKRIEFQILHWEYSGAWVVWSSECYGIFMTRKLINNIQHVCGQGGGMVSQIAGLPPDSNFIMKAWGTLPRTSEYYRCFGEIIASIAVTFVVNHELAHAGLGHERMLEILSEERCKMRGTASEQKCDDGGFLAESCIPDVHAAAEQKINLRNQAIETDADINGLMFTRAFVEKYKQHFAAIELGDESSVLDKAWKNILKNDSGRELILITGVGVGLLALVDSLEVPKIGRLDDNTHPPIVARWLALLHANSQLGCKEFVASDSILTVATLVAMFKLYEKANKEPEETKKATDEKSAPTKALGDGLENCEKAVNIALARIGIPEMIGRYDQIGEHLKNLSTEMSVMRNITEHHRRFGEAHLTKWEE